MNQKENKKDYAKIIGNLAPYIGLVAVIILFEALTGGALLSSGNVQALINSVIVTALAALGAVFVFGSGYFDMSLGG